MFSTEKQEKEQESTRVPVNDNLTDEEKIKLLSEGLICADMTISLLVKQPRETFIAIVGRGTPYSTILIPLLIAIKEPEKRMDLDARFLSKILPKTLKILEDKKGGLMTEKSIKLIDEAKEILEEYMKEGRENKDES